jgi:hypothetical protein
VDKLTDKYHDKVYDHLPAWKKKQQRQEAQDQRAGQQQRQNQAPANEQQEYQQHSRRDSAAERNVNDREVNFDNDRDMSYGQSQAGSYAPRRQDPRDYQDDRDRRYQEEGAYRPPPPPNAGTIEMRDSEAYPPPPMGKFGGEVSVCKLLSRFHCKTDMTTRGRHIRHHHQHMTMDTMTAVIADDRRLPECAPIRGHRRATRNTEEKIRDAVDVRDRVQFLPTTVRGTRALQRRS